jgi:hypothetical protein
VVVEGFQKFEAGDVVDPVPWQAAQSGVTTSAATIENAQPASIRYSNAR